MSQPFDSDNKTKSGRYAGNNRGFFTVLMLCLIAIGGVAATTFSDHFQPPLEPQEPESTTAATVITTTTAKPVAVKPATTTTVTTTVIQTETTTTTTAPASLFVLPLTNKVLTPYSEQPLYNKTLDNYRAHTAIDFDGEEGQSIRPLASGTVSAVENDPFWGGRVTVDHGAGVITVYSGVSPTVEVGDELTTDDRIGILDTVPCESDLGPHLHFELYKDGKAADATALFDGQLVYN